MSLSAFLAYLVPAFSTIGALPLEKKLILVASLIGVFGAIRSVGQFAWPRLRRHGFTYQVFRLGVFVAVVLAVLQIAALAGTAFMNTPVDLTWIATGLGAVIVVAATVHAYFQLKHRPTFNMSKLIAMFALQLSPVGAYYSWTLLRRGGMLIAAF